MAQVSFKPPEDTSERFKAYWDMFVKDIEKRENLKPSHMYQLKVLCDVCVEYDTLHGIIELIGRSYESIGRNGIQYKLRPEVMQMNRILAEIRNYSKILGLVLVKDTENSNVPEEANDFD